MSPAEKHPMMPEPPTHAGVRVGIDIVRIAAIVESIDTFGEHFVTRLFHADEITWIRSSPAQSAERAAARFAAKEAAIKAFGLAEVGVRWPDLEVRRAPGGACRLVLHGSALRHACANGLAPASLSLSHDGDYAVAIVMATPVCFSDPVSLSLSAATP